MEGLLIYDSSLIIDEYKTGSYCMFLRHVDINRHHDIPETLGVDLKKIKKDFEPYRTEKICYSLHEIKKVNEGNYVVPGRTSVKHLAEILTVNAKSYLEEFKDETVNGFLTEYLKKELKVNVLKKDANHKDKFFEYVVVETKNDIATKIIIHLVDSDEPIISNEEAEKVNLTQRAIWSYEAGYILGTDKSNNKIYVQFEDTKEDECHVFLTAIELDPINNKIMEMVKMYGDRIE